MQVFVLKLKHALLQLYAKDLVTFQLTLFIYELYNLYSW